MCPNQTSERPPSLPPVPPLLRQTGIVPLGGPHLRVTMHSLHGDSLLWQDSSLLVAQFLRQLAVMSTLDKVNLCLQMLLAMLISQELSYLQLIKDPLASHGLLLGLQANPLPCLYCVCQ